MPIQKCVGPRLAQEMGLKPIEQNNQGKNGLDSPLLTLDGVVKRFPGCLANDNVDLVVRKGEIRALLGENGAGKSTLVKIIYGLLAADEGRITWRGEPVTIEGPAVARDMGIAMVFQHFSLFETMTVLENILLAMPKGTSPAELRERVVRISRDYGLPLDPGRHVHTMSVGERQRIEIVRCLLLDPSLLILDEPTSVLTPQEAISLFSTLRQIAREGRAILYISHKLEEVKALCHTATVLRAGRVVAECNPSETSARAMAELMIGDRLQSAERGDDERSGQIRLTVKGLTLAAADQFGTDLQDISFGVAEGEILGIAGVAGNGQRELMEALSGEGPALEDPHAILIEGAAAGQLGPAARRRLGAAFVPEERIDHGSVQNMTLSENAFLTAFRRLGLTRLGLIDRPRTRGYARQVIDGFDVRASGTEAEARSLSGGNLQKFIVGREILQEPRILVIAQPTWGVDAGAAAAIHQALIDLARRGCSVLVISQDLDEIFAICDRIAVLSDGKLSEPRPIQAVSVDEVGLLMGGLHDMAAIPEAGGREASLG